MSKSSEAKWLLNTRGRVTLHVPVRLEVRGKGRRRGIYVVYRCTQTSSIRDFGCLGTGTSTSELQRLYPSLELVEQAA